jgi:CO/xanthine dehydrogenase Mo-binding subunit
MDELAVLTKSDPVAYRLRHLSSERLAGVLKAAAQGANWQARPAPAPRKSGIVTGRGISCVAYEGDNGYVATVVQADVNQDSGQVLVKRIVTAVDCGPISNPNGLRNQCEGGTLQGLSRALLEEATWDDQKVTSISWSSYHVLPFAFELPQMDIILLNHPEEEATGAGELSITVISSALGNAIFDATGVRIRELPFTPQRVKAALSSRS